MEATKNAYSFEDLFIEFDEMGFQPTTLCPDFEGYAIAWKERLVSLVKELQQRVSILEADNDDYKDKIAENELVSIDWHNEQVGHLEEEIERLTKRCELADKDNDNLAKTIFELEKQVDEQKAEIERLNNCVMSEEQVYKCCADIIQDTMSKAEKKAAKEIIQWIKLNGTLGYGGYVIHDSTIEQICKKCGVEVE